MKQKRFNYLYSNKQHIKRNMKSINLLDIGQLYLIIRNNKKRRWHNNFIELWNRLYCYEIRVSIRIYKRG